MADPQQNLVPPEVPDAPFPAPPPFWKQFTTKNLEEVKEKEGQDDFDPEELSYSLAVLRPPPTPSAAYTVFNTTYTDPPEPTLPQSSELLFDPADLTRAGPSSNGRPHVRMLLLLVKSLMLNFLEFTTIMADDPVSWEAKMKDIGMILENIMAVINLLRPHQARESVKAMLERRLAEGREEMERCDEMKAKIENFLSDVEEEATGEKSVGSEHHPEQTNQVNGHSSNITGNKKNDADIEKARRIWAMLDSLDID